jgi:hypothetical protein
MNQDASITGAEPESNKVKENELALIELKKVKILEITKASTDVVNVLELAKQNPLLSDLNLDLNSVLSLLFGDKHFVDSKFY